MIVKELITELQKYDGNDEVLLVMPMMTEDKPIKTIYHQKGYVGLSRH